MKGRAKLNLLGITINDKHKFDRHINKQCKLYILYRFIGIFDKKEREVIHNNVIPENCTYCPLVWNFCDKSSAWKIENTQERALRFLLSDKISLYTLLLEKSNSTTLHVRRIKAI